MNGIELAIAWAKYLLELNKKNPGHIDYSEGANRMSAIGQWPLKFPITTDCSGFVTLVYWLAGLADPNGLGYDHEGYTGTLLSHDAHIPLFAKNAQGVNFVDVQPGDLVIYGPGTGWHVGLVVEVDGSNILTISNGEQGDPSYVWASLPACPSRGFPTDGRTPQTYLRPSHAINHEAKQIPKTAPATPQAPQTPPVAVSITADTTAHSAAVATATNAIGLPSVKLGANGQLVQEIQAHLHIKADGIFGPVTEQAVKAFQTAHRLPVDGIVGPQTWAALGI